MSKPDFQTLMLPLLESLKDGEMHSMEYIRLELIRYIDYSDVPLKPFDLANKEEFESGMMLALEHLTKAGLTERPGSDQVKITSLGKLVLTKRLNTIDMNYLRRFLT